MKRHLLLLLTGATLLWSAACFAVPVNLGDSGGANSNPHNLSSLSGNTKKALNETQICIFCHTPHGATPKSTLWNRPNPTGGLPTFAEPGSVQDLSNILGINDAGIVASDTHYGVNDATYEYPNGASKLCLSCHDGVTAMGILANGDIIDMNVTGGDYALGINLAVSHPISFVYNLNVRNYLNGLPKTGNYIWPTTAYLETNSLGTWVQCTTCHQPHQDTKDVGYRLPFWRGAGSSDEAEYDAVCNACHDTLYDINTFPDHAYPLN